MGTDQSSSRRRRRQGGWEADAYSAYWRKYIWWRAGGRKGVKELTHRRERREARQEIREGTS